MRTLLARGMAAAESARQILAEDGDRTGRPALAEAWRTFDTDGAQLALDELLGRPEPEVVVARQLLPILVELPSERRHFAQRMVETRLLALGASWHEGLGPLALAGCGPGEHDTVELLVLALALRRRGWRIVYLGADTPVDVFASVAAALSPERVIVGFRDPGRAQSFTAPFDATVRVRRPAGDGDVVLDRRQLADLDELETHVLQASEDPVQVVLVLHRPAQHRVDRFDDRGQPESVREVIADTPFDPNLVDEGHPFAACSAFTG